VIEESKVRSSLLPVLLSSNVYTYLGASKLKLKPDTVGVLE
jgi:hypothetical protein